MITSVNKINKCSPRHCRPLLQKNLGRVSPFNASYQNCCKKKYVNDSQNLAFATSHFVIELLPFDYLSNQNQWVNRKMHFKRNNFIPPFFLFLAWWPSWLEVGITGHNFGRGPSKDHSTKVWLQLAQWFLRIFMWISHRVQC